MLRPQFVLFGDSLTQRSFDEGGWGGRLASEYQRKVDVINRGYSGYNTRWVKHIMPMVFPVSQKIPPELVTIFFGANDAALPDRLSARQHVPVEEYRGNLLSIVQHVQSLGTKDIVLITPPPLDEAARIRHNQQQDEEVSEATSIPERTNSFTSEYAAAAKQLANELGLPVLDLFTEIPKQKAWQTEYLEDGLHFTPAGNKAVFDLLLETIRKDLPHLRAEELSDDFPSHRDIDETDPAKSFVSHA
ncbi:Isoamyl acetate-hydrolyzing esterase 1 homolog [Coccomyxa sp. Obi]|nr:Isoamyl acetate-hydrolyzing esterase 1 homolog [Coccomyxa sp. Obi]